MKKLKTLNNFLEYRVHFVTSDRTHFQHIQYSATYCWKGLNEYFPNIYGFMGQNLVLFELNSLIISLI